MNSPEARPTPAPTTPGPMTRHSERGGSGTSRVETGGRCFVGNRSRTDTAGPPHQSMWRSSVARIVTELTGRQLLQEELLDLVERDPLLLHRVAVAHRRRVVLERVEVDGDAVRRADLVLPPVAPADRARVVEVGVPAQAQVLRQLL